MGQQEMDRIFDWLKSLKSIHKISYDRMAEAIGYSAVGVSKALKKETLSKDQVYKIADHVGFGEDFSKLFLTNTNEKTPQEDVRFEDLVADKVYQKMDARLKNLEEQNKEIKEQNRGLTELMLGMIPVTEQILNSLSEIKNKGEV